jgi:NAD(P)-dependent dehydrogenase (short-subunit alcohol dehydrogenase family)
MSAADLFSVENRVVCISGASRGLGKGLAAMFAERGARVVIASPDHAELSAAQAELAAEGLLSRSIHQRGAMSPCAHAIRVRS